MDDHKDRDCGAAAPSPEPTRLLISRSLAAYLCGISLSSLSVKVRRGHLEAESAAARSPVYQDSVVKYVAKKRELLDDGSRHDAAELEGIQARMLEERKRKVELGAENFNGKVPWPGHFRLPPTMKALDAQPPKP